MSRPTFIKSEKYCVETETNQDLAKDVKIKTISDFSTKNKEIQD